MASESIQGSDEADEMYCELCKPKGRSRSAEGFCADCVKYFCSVCLEYHSDFFPNHVQKDKFSMPQDFCLKPCSVHVDEIIKFYCPSCKQFFCFFCKEQNHTKCSGVSHLPAFVQNLDLKDQARATRETLEKTLETVTQKKEEINKRITSVEAFSMRAKTAADMQAKAVKDLVDASCMKLKQEISKLEDADKANLQSIRTKLDTLKNEVEFLKNDINKKEELGKRCEIFMSLTTGEATPLTDRASRILLTKITEYSFEASTIVPYLLEDQSLGSINKSPNFSLPTKIAETLSEIYDNEWTDAFEVLIKVQTDEKAITQELLNMLVRVFNECRRLAENRFFERIQDCIEFPGSPEQRPKRTSDVKLSHHMMQLAMDFRRIRATSVLKDIEEVILQTLRLDELKKKEIQRYLSRCVEIGWLSAVQDPPLTLFTIKPPEKFDTNMFRFYTKTGPYVDYVVWPALLLHEYGPLLARGVAQGYDNQGTYRLKRR